MKLGGLPQPRDVSSDWKNTYEATCSSEALKKKSPFLRPPLKKTLDSSVMNYGSETWTILRERVERLLQGFSAAFSSQYRRRTAPEEGKITKNRHPSRMKLTYKKY